MYTHGYIVRGHSTSLCIDEGNTRSVNSILVSTVYNIYSLSIYMGSVKIYTNCNIPKASNISIYNKHFFIIHGNISL